MMEIWGLLQAGANVSIEELTPVECKTLYLIEAVSRKSGGGGSRMDKKLMR